MSVSCISLLSHDVCVICNIWEVKPSILWRAMRIFCSLRESKRGRCFKLSLFIFYRTGLSMSDRNNSAICHGPFHCLFCPKDCLILCSFRDHRRLCSWIVMSVESRLEFIKN